ncbi:antigen-presenting glycoprotein CD1d-like [Emydura macquarii macquarii]|uniref:antigen-presenting glycoprotein CD1d-like n=1 Tax=Emydura macquarii macquarii TaxID=1129001 RepID=UPI00352AA803
MLPWPLLLPWAWAALAASPAVSPGSVTLQVLGSAFFHNASSTDMQVQILLGDLETHSLNCSTCKIRFLQPWAHQGLAPGQWQDLETEIHLSLANFIRTANGLAPQYRMGYPFVIQASIGCQLHPNGTSRGFYDVAVNGEDFISFDADAGTWVARPGDKQALDVSNFVNLDNRASTRLQYFLRTTCINLIQILAQYGRESLERQERPVAVVFARVSPPAGTPAPLLLVCRVTGFYPRPIHVAWLQDGEEVEPGWRLNSTGTLPNADLTYQRHSSLAVQPGDGHSYACRVDHSSLGGQSLLIPWDHGSRWIHGLAAGIILGVLAVVAVAAVLWWSRCRAYQDFGVGESSALGGSTGPGERIGPSLGDMELGTRSAPGSGAEGPEGWSALER